jgi:hypothetical protein
MYFALARFGYIYHIILTIAIRCILFIFSLPWQGLKADTKQQKYDNIAKKKMKTSIEVR